MSGEVMQVAPQPAALVQDAYEAFGKAVATVDDGRSWLPTGCVGWAVRDLVFHCLCDAQRGLVALHTPADGAADRDAVSYWADWQPDTSGAAAGRRAVRVAGSMFLHFEQLRDVYLETTAALVHAAHGADSDTLVATQGHVLSAGDLLRTLAVEATVHHLDMVVSWPEALGPSAAGLGEVRRILDGLLGRAVPVPWDDARYARAATGRVALSEVERTLLGQDADRFPLFG